MKPEEVIHEMYAAFGAKDEPRLHELLAPDVRWNQCPGFPGGARRRGVADVIAGVLGTNHELWLGFGISIAELLPSGDSVVVLGHYHGTHAKTGKPMRADFAHVYRVEGGQVTRFDQITDTAPMVAAMSA